MEFILPLLKELVENKITNIDERISMKQQEYKYFAFISYNSLDYRWGKRIQKKLEHYPGLKVGSVEAPNNNAGNWE